MYKGQIKKIRVYVRTKYVKYGMNRTSTVHVQDVHIHNINKDNMLCK